MLVGAQSVLWTANGHPDQRAVYGVGFSANGQYVLSGSECPQAHLRMFSTASGSITWDHEVSSDLLCTMGVKFSSNGSYLANMEELGNLEIYQVNGGTATLLNTLTNSTGAAFSVDFAPTNDKVLTGAGNGRMIIYSLPSGSVLLNQVAHTGQVLGVAWSNDGQYLCTGGNDGLVKVWTPSGTLVRTINAHTGFVYDVAFSPDGQRIISCGQDDKVRVWNTASGAMVHDLTGHTSDVRGVDVSPNGAYLVSGSVDQTTRIWDMQSGAQLHSLTSSGSGFIFSVAWSPTESKIAAGALNNRVILWSVPLVSVPEVKLRARCFLEGPFNTNTGLMNTTLRSNGLVPTVEPYTAIGYQHVGGGGEASNATVLGLTGSNAIVDWVVVELRSVSAPSQVLATRSALLQADGDIVAANDGASPLSFNVANGNYHVAIRHRNHLGAMTSGPVALSGTAVTVDMSNGSVALYGGAAATKVVGSKNVFYAGDVNRNGSLSYVGLGNDRDPILVRIGGSTPTNTITGYHSEDLNLDGVVRYIGAGNDRDPILVNIGGSVPTATRAAQLP